jgi:hypothetical protein
MMSESTTESTTAPAAEVDIAALGKTITKVHTVLGKLDTDFDSSLLAPFKDKMEEAKEAIEGLKTDYSETGKVNVDKLVDLQKAVLDLRNVSNSPLDDPSKSAQLKEMGDDFDDIGLNLEALLLPHISTTTSTTTRKASLPSIDIAALGVVLNKVDTALEHLDLNVDPIVSAVYSEDIKEAKNAVVKLKKDFVNTGEVDEEKVKELQKSLLDLRDVPDLKLTEPGAVAQMKETGDDLADIDFDLGALLLPPTTTTTAETSTKSIDIAAVGGVISKLDNALEKLDTGLDPSQLDQYSEDLAGTKEVVKQIKDTYTQTGEVKREDLEKLQDAMLDLRDVTNLEPALTDPAAR